MPTLAMRVATLVCPDCGAPMELRDSRFGQFYGCTTWRATGCRGSHGAHPDGSPLGIPADATTKRARIAAHDAFDGWWKAKGMRRSAGYRWLRETLGLSKRGAHIGRFTIAQCELLIAAIQREED